MKTMSFLFAIMMVSVASLSQTTEGTKKVPDGFVSLFNGKNLDNWKIPAGDNGHWKVVNGVIDYDAESESKRVGT